MYVFLYNTLYPLDFHILKTSIDFDIVKTIYTTFFDTIHLSKCYYPSSFLETLPFANNMYTYHDYELEKLFVKWAYKTSLQISKSYFQSVKLYVKRKWNRQTISIPETTQIIESPVEDVDKIISESVITPDNKPVTCFMAYNDYEDVNPMFKKRKTHLNMFLCQNIIDQQQSTPHLKVKDINQSTYTCLILFNNKDTNQYKTTYLASDYIQYLSTLSEIGIQNIEMKYVGFFPTKPIVKELANLNNINDYKDMSAFLNTLSDMYKVLHMKKFKALYYKATLEYLYNNYEFSTDSTVSFDDMFKEFEKYHTPALEQLPLSVLMNQETFHNMMGLLGFTINNNQVCYLSKKNVRNNISLLKTSKVHSILKDNKKLINLRLEPTIEIKPVGPWHLSSSIF